MLEIKHKYTRISLRVAYILIYFLFLFPSPFYIVYNSFPDAFVLFSLRLAFFLPARLNNGALGRTDGMEGPIHSLPSPPLPAAFYSVIFSLFLSLSLSLSIRGARELEMRLQSLEHILQKFFSSSFDCSFILFFSLFPIIAITLYY